MHAELLCSVPLHTVTWPLLPLDKLFATGGALGRVGKRLYRDTAMAVPHIRNATREDVPTILEFVRESLSYWKTRLSSWRSMKKHWIRFKPLRNLYVPAMKLTHVLCLANKYFVRKSVCVRGHRRG